jgi:hypothetical protein
VLKVLRKTLIYNDISVTKLVQSFDREGDGLS